MPVRRAHLRPFKEIRGQLSLGQFNPDCRRSWAVGIGRRLDPAQTVAQHPPQGINREPKRLSLRRQIKDQLFLVVGQIILHRADFGILPQGILQILRCGFQHLRVSAVELHIQRVPPGTRPPAAKADGFGKGMIDHRVLQFGDKGEAGIRAQIGVDQLDRDAAQQIGVLAVGPVQTTPRIAPDLRDHIVDGVGAVFLGVLRAQRFCRALHFAHHRQRIGTGGPFGHGKITRHRPAFRRIEEPPLHVTLDEQRHLRGQHSDHTGKHHIARADHPRHEGAEQPFAHPEKPAIDHSAGQVIPPLLGPCCHRMGHMVRQDQKTFNQ